jgi:hypothetical protein
VVKLSVAILLTNNPQALNPLIDHGQIFAEIMQVQLPRSENIPVFQQ